MELGISPIVTSGLIMQVSNYLIIAIVIMFPLSSWLVLKYWRWETPLRTEHYSMEHKNVCLCVSVSIVHGYYRDTRGTSQLFIRMSWLQRCPVLVIKVSRPGYKGLLLVFQVNLHC